MHVTRAGGGLEEGSPNTAAWTTISRTQDGIGQMQEALRLRALRSGTEARSNFALMPRRALCCPGVLPLLGMPTTAVQPQQIFRGLY